MVFEEGKSTGVMGSYNRCGLMETAANYYLLTSVLREEWGFKGAVLSDMTHSGNGSVNFKCYECVCNRNIAGCSLQLDSGGFSGQTKNGQGIDWDATLGGPAYTYNGEKVISYTWWNSIRRTYKENMYMYANCTAQAQGVTTIIDNQELSFQAGKAIKIDVTENMPEEINGKTVENVDYELNYRVTLPEGLKFANNTISGKIKHTGLYRIDVIAKITYEGQEEPTDVFAIKYAIEITPNMANNGLNGAGVNSAVIVGASVGGGVLVLAAAAVVVILLLKKKKTA